MFRRRRRSVALAACAALALGLPVAAATPRAQAADPAVHAEWRGWVAYQQEIVTESPPWHMVDRYWSVDVSRSSGDGQWSGNHYRFHNDGCTSECCDSPAEGEASGNGATNGGTDNGVAVGGGINPLDYGSEGGFKFFAPAEGELAGYDFGETCNGTPPYTTGWTQLPHSVDVGVKGSYDDPPVTATVDTTWSWPDTTRRAVACMTRSTVDSDGDGLPDEVDLAPDAAGDPLDLGHPQGSAAWDEEIPSKIGGPAGVQGLPLCPAAPDQPEKKVMVSLGDSYSSGEGAYGYDPATNERGVNHCHRSASAYPRVAFGLLQAAGADFAAHQFFACSGALQKNLTWETFCGSGCGEGEKEDPQLEQLRDLVAEGAPVEVVTVGIGGNDAGFGEVIKMCLTPLTGNCIARFDESLPGGKLPGPTVEQVAERVAKAVDQTLAATHDSNAAIVLVGYPVFISKSYEGCPNLGGDGPGATQGIGPEEAEWIRGQILTMNRALEKVASDPTRERVHYLSLDTAYGDNVLCNGGSEASQWVHGPVVESTATDQESCIATASFDLANRRISICNESFHPKAEGHAAAGQALAQCISDGICGTASTEEVRDAVELVVQPPEVDCVFQSTPGVCDAGPLEDGLKVRAAGFKPGTRASLALHSRPVELGEEIVRSDGTVEFAVTIRPGTVPPGRHHLVVTGPGEETIIRAATAPLNVLCSSGFADVPTDHAFCGDITWMKSTGVTSGYSDGTFQPGLGLSRAQMASFLWRLAGQPVVAASAPSFADVPAGSPHATAVRWLAARGITTGYPDGTFKPDLGLTRAHMAAFLHRFADQPPPSGSAPTFPDVSVDNQFATAISWLAGEGITLGKSDGTYGPADALNRQQMAAFLHRFGEPRGLPE